MADDYRELYAGLSAAHTKLLEDYRALRSSRDHAIHTVGELMGSARRVLAEVKNDGVAAPRTYSEGVQEGVQATAQCMLAILQPEAAGG